MSLGDLDRRFFADDFQEAPYWWRAAQPERSEEFALPTECDAAVVGSGFGGLSAALTLARAGLSVAVIDAAEIGSGACTRNMGGVPDRIEGMGSKDPNGTLFGRPVRDYLEEGRKSAEFIVGLAASEDIECHVRDHGRLILATNDKALRNMENLIASRRATESSCEDYVLTREALSSEVGGALNKRYAGALVVKRTTTLHPGKLVRGLIGAVRQAGGMFHANTRVENVTSLPTGGFEIATTRGTIRARSVVVTTAAYSDAGLPELQRRVFPFGAHVIATEPLGEDLLSHIIPKRRMLSDTHNMFMSMGPTADSTRLLFAGAYLSKPSPLKHALDLRSELVALFPELSSIRVSNAWFGYMPLTRGVLPKMAEIDGVLYSVASNWPMNALLGHKAALRILGIKGSESPFENGPFDPFPRVFQPPIRVRAPLRWMMRSFDKVGFTNYR